MHEMKVDIKEGRLSGLLPHDVRVPDLVEHRSRWHGSFMIPEHGGLTRWHVELAATLLIINAFDMKNLAPRSGAADDADGASRQAQCLGDQATNCVVRLSSFGLCAHLDSQRLALPADYGVLARARRDTNGDARQS